MNTVYFDKQESPLPSRKKMMQVKDKIEEEDEDAENSSINIKCSDRSKLNSSVVKSSHSSFDLTSKASASVKKSLGHGSRSKTSNSSQLDIPRPIILIGDCSPSGTNLNSS